MTCETATRDDVRPKARAVPIGKTGRTKIVVMREEGTRVKGAMPPETVKRFLRANFPSLRMCYEDALLRSAGKAHGYVKIELEIAEQGGARWATTRSTVADANHSGAVTDLEMLRCVEAVVSCIPFPAPEEGTVSVTYPLSFTTHEAVEYVNGLIEWRGSVSFTRDTDKLEEPSPDLDALASLLTAAKEIDLVEIGDFVHLDLDDTHAVELSEARAHAVVAALVQRGVAPSRLLARGYGRYCPNLPNASEHARRSNERIAVVVVKSGGKPTGAQRGCKAARDNGIAPAPLP